MKRILNILKNLKHDYDIDICLKIPMVIKRFDPKYINALNGKIRIILEFFRDNYDYKIPQLRNITPQYYLNFQLNNLLLFL